MKALHNITDMIGAIISLPILLAIIQLVRYADKIKNTVNATTVSLKETAESINSILDDHETRIREHERKVPVLWAERERKISSLGDR